MAPRTISPVSGFIVNVMGSISATPIAAESPGMQPMIIPMATPPAIISRLIGLKALRKPAPIKDNVSSITLFSSHYDLRAFIKVPVGSFTPRNFWKAK